jgi:UPF0755 protein
VRRFVTRSCRILATLLVFCGLVVLYLWLYYQTPAGRDSRTQTVYIPPGASLRQIATQLADANLIRHRLMFMLYVVWLAPGPHLQAGEYALRSTLSPVQIVDIMRRGKTVQHALTIPEGLTIRDIAALVEAKGLGNRRKFIELAHDASFIASLGLEVPSLEGYLFPDTYYVTRGMPERDLLRLMVRTLREHYRDDIALRGRQLGLNQHEVLTLASLIETEASVAAERPLIAAVYHNRLRRGMRLQCDPTVIYALGERFDGDLRKADLGIDSPYNTYRYPGLPPGPIANPGLRSIEAAVAPASVDYLYFVATGEHGSHKFSRTLREHNAAVRRYQLGQR